LLVTSGGLPLIRVIRRRHAALGIRRYIVNLLVLRNAAVDVACHRDDGVVLARLGEGHALGVAAGAVHLAHRGTDDVALLHDDHDLVLLVDDERSDELTALVPVGRHDADAAAVLRGPLRGGGPLGHAV